MPPRPACSTNPRSPATTEPPAPAAGSGGRYIRLAGELTLADGAQLTWSVADGSRGRRWRAVARVDGAITHAALLEIDLAGRPARLELTTPSGLLTLHPSADQAEMHGNIVYAGGWGVKALPLRWDPERELDIAGRPLALGIGLHRRRSSVPVGATIEIDVVVIDSELSIHTTIRRVERLSDTDWRVQALNGAVPDRLFRIDADGLPLGGERWPLEPD